MSASEQMRYMQHALRLAHAMLGRVAPNPAVGAVLVRDGVIVGIGATARDGRPHAETQAIEMAGERAAGSCLYVTLEPCAHHGETPPCAEAVIKAGITQAVIAMHDPDPRVSGRGIAMLEAAGVAVTLGICEREATQLNEGFIQRITGNRPMVSLKLASSLDGKIATASGKSQWITGQPARDYGHALRANHDAILTGIGTVLADNPRLDCRLPGRGGDSPIRILLDRSLRIEADSHLVQTARQQPLWIATGHAMLDSHKAASLAQAGAIMLDISTDAPDEAQLHALLSECAERGITRLLVEAGPTLSTALLTAGLVDWLYWMRAPILIGQSGRDAIATLPDCPLADIATLPRSACFTLGEDEATLYRVSPCLPA